MTLFDRIFGGLNEHKDDPVIKFGRFTDAHKSQKQLDAWEEALACYNQDQFSDSLLKTLEYLKDDTEDNVIFTQSKDEITFEIRQGSKCIHGVMNNKKIHAEAKVVRTNGYSIGYLRRMIEKNYSLNYSRFALDPENNLTIVFDTVITNSSPFKLYKAFKEMAIHADKQDDILLDEFASLSPINQGHLTPLTDNEKEAKYNYLISKTNLILSQIDQLKLSPDKKPGAESYLLLDLIYRLDYLISPEGKTMEAFEKIHRTYYKKNGKSVGQKNAKLISQLKEIITRPKDSFLSEFYNITSTFGITNPVPHAKLVEIIDPEIKYLNWYMQNKQPVVAEAVCGFIAGYALFSFALPKPDHQLLHLYLSITEAVFFNDLGMNKIYVDPESKKVNKSLIEKELKDIEESNKDDYPELDLPIGNLNYNSISQFSRSYFLMLRQLVVVKKERSLI